MEYFIYGVYPTRKSGFNYEIRGDVNGQKVTAYTNDAEIYDHMKYNSISGTDEEKEQRYEAEISCVRMLKEAYNKL